MSCYSPRVRVEQLGKYKYAADGHRYNDFKIYSTKDLEMEDLFFPGQKVQIIPCGKCIGCRLDYSKEWANRGYLESLYSYAYFITLTYDEEHLHIPLQMVTDEGVTFLQEDAPTEWKGMLVPKDFTLFNKRLRKELSKNEKYKCKMRFIACGEYGEKGHRPHYHEIIYLDKPIPMEDLTPDKQLSKKGEPQFFWNVLDKTWKKGRAVLSEANWQTIAYVARYITKKQFGDYAEEYYKSRGQTKEFFRVSRKPGIGYQYYEDHKEEIYRYDKILINKGKSSEWESPPKYYDKMYEEEFPDDFEIIKLNRRKKAMSANRLTDSTTSLDRWELLQVKLREKVTQADTLFRDLE